MRIERRGAEEWLVNAPYECDGCDEVNAIGGSCCHHIHGEHLAVGYPASDGACLILARWPIRPAAVDAAHSTLRSAEEIAREMVIGPIALGSPTAPRCRFEIHDGDVSVAMYEHMTEDGARRAAERGVDILTALIDRSRAEGAAAERERLRNASPVALHKPTEVRVGQVWRNLERGRDVEVSSVAGGIAKFGPNCDIICSTAHMLELEAWLFVRHGRDLAGRIRALVQEWAGRLVDARGTERDRIQEAIMLLIVEWESARAGGGPEALRDWIAETRRLDAPRWAYILQAANDVEAILRECEAQR